MKFLKYNNIQKKSDNDITMGDNQAYETVAYETVAYETVAYETVEVDTRCKAGYGEKELKEQDEVIYETPAF